MYTGSEHDVLPRKTRGERLQHRYLHALHRARRCILVYLVGITAAYTAQDSGAESSSFDERGALSILIENDVFAGTDRHYTNGLQISYLTGPRSTDSIAARLGSSNSGETDNEVRIGWQLGQSIFTPENKDATELLPEQRPYAAWLYVGLSFVYSSDEYIDTWRFNVGTVGPAAKGEEVQNGFHDFGGNDRANGWANQIDNQLGAELIVERTWHALAQTDVWRFDVDLIPHVSLSLGNIEQYANTGVTFRIGNDLGNDFGPPRIRPSLPGSAFFIPHDGWSWYLFAGIDGRYVNKNIVLDDNDQKELWNIEKKNWVADAQAGLVITRGDFRLAYTYVYRTEEFKQQLEPDRFGSFALTWQF